MTDAFHLLCEDTTKLSRADWLDLRSNYIGSSDAAAALGMSPWQSAYSLWAIKRGLMPEQEMTERYAWALAMEPVILDWWRSHDAWGLAEGTGRRHLMVCSPEYPWLACNPDDLYDNVVVECKTAHSMDERRWFDPETGAPAVPDHYAIQVTQQMIVTGRRQAVIVVSFGSEAPKEFVVDFDEGLADIIITETEKFWLRVQNDDPPDVDGSEATMLALRAQFHDVDPDKSIELPATLWAAIEETRPRAQADVTRGMDALAELKAQVMFELGVAETALSPSGEFVVARWKARRDGVRVFTWAKERA